MSGNSMTDGGKPVIAHTGHGGHLLVEHVREVARLARAHGDTFGGGELAYWAGLWHDLGKFNPEFQRYLYESEAGERKRRTGPDHKAAGAQLALTYCQPLTLPLVGHHGGLKDRDSDLRAWLSERTSTAEVAEALALARAALPELEPVGRLEPPAWVRDAHTAELFIRMLFSALVDADWLDTEAHGSPEKSAARGGYPPVAELWPVLERYQEGHTGIGNGPVNQVRDEVYRSCLAAAGLPPGFFRLTVPTGGGKTRSGLAFALRHAVSYGMERVIVAIPYTSITDQTAGVYREIFRDQPRAVLEHHSAVQPESNDGAAQANWEELAAENWDAPIVVTTTVRFFESLLGCTGSACRRLHNIARSVVVLDEVQTLPERHLTPILSVLRELVAHYGVTVVLSTATQPALDERAGFGGLPDVREIVPDPAAHFARLQRVEYVAAAEPWPWERVAGEMLESTQTLTIVNTKADALALLDALGAQGAGGLLHLSTNLCGAHRWEVLAEVRRRLREGLACRLVATQVVEAGVDLDFPLVLRAIGPLDRIVQAAGRCNREGRLDIGRVVVFQPEEGGVPRGAYETGTTLTANMLRAGTLDFHEPETYRRYFADLYGRVDLDYKQIQRKRAEMAYRTVASDFRLIDDDAVSVVVPYWEKLPNGESLATLLQNMQEKRGNPREQWRAIQPLIVGVRARVLRSYEQAGMAWEIVPGLYQWKGGYDQTRGIVERGPNPAELVI